MLKGITKKIIISFLVSSIAILFVMPFNILNADTSYFAGIHIFTDTSDHFNIYSTNYYSVGTSTNSADTYLVGYTKNYNSTNNNTKYNIFSSSSFQTHYYRQNGTTYSQQGSTSFLVNGNTFYRAFSDLLDGYPVVNSDTGLPYISATEYKFGNAGLLYEYLKASNQLSVINPLTKINANEPFYTWLTTDPSQPYVVESNVDCYVVAMKNPSSNDLTFYIMCNDENATVRCYRGQTSTSLTRGIQYIGNNEIVTYSHTSWSYNANYHYTFNINDVGATNKLDIPILLYNDEVYDVAPPVNYGDLKINFYTKYAGSGGSDDLTWRENEDVLQWSPIDTNGFNIADYGLIEIRAVPGSYVASSYGSLIAQGINDFVLENFSELSQRSYILNPYDQEYRRKWGNIVDNYLTDIPLFNLYAYTANNSWYKNGWVWQARIVDFEDPTTPITEWQTVYNSTSFSGNDGLNNPTLNPDSFDTFQEINNTNNITNNTWYINNVPMNVDPNSTTSDGTWIEKLIESIAELIGTIVQSVSDIIKAIAGFGSDIIQGIFNLISNLGVNILDTFTNLWNGFINLFNGINFTDDNPEFDLDLGVEDGDSPLDIIPAFVRMMNSSGLGYMLWLPLVVGIIFMVL